MENRKIPAAHGWLWIKQGWALFRQSPLLWMALTMIGMAGMMLISVIPLVGEPLSTLLFPLFYGGLLLGCAALQKGEELELAHLFAGLQTRPQQLVTLGGLTLVAQLLILGLMKMMGAAELVDIMMGAQPPGDPAQLTQAVELAGSAVLVGLALFTVLLLATQFAPMLVLFQHYSPLAAMQTSLRLCLSNMLPLSLYGALMLSFAFLASLPMMLGWPVLLPLMITSIYAAYQDLTGTLSPDQTASDAPTVL